MSSKIITILLPTYQRPRLLKRAIQSVLSQSFDKLILRVYDNGNDDETQALMQAILEKDNRVEYMRHQINIGCLANFHKLFASVDSEYCMLLSDDDFLLPGFLGTGHASLQEHPQALFYSSATLTCNLLNSTFQRKNSNWEHRVHFPSKKATEKVLLEHFTSTGTIFTKQLLDKTSGFHHLGLDEIFSVLITGSFPFVADPNPGAAFTVHEKRLPFSGWLNISLPQILLSYANDQSIALSFASEATKDLLLAYLWRKYSQLIDSKLLSAVRSDSTSEVLQSYSPHGRSHFSLSRSILFSLKRRIPDIVLAKISNLKNSQSLPICPKYIEDIVDSNLSLYLNGEPLSEADTTATLIRLLEII